MWWRDLRKVWNLEEWDNDFEDKGKWVLGDRKKLGFGSIRGWITNI